jgi:hypothetical protein
MNHMSKIALGLTLAIGMASGIAVESAQAARGGALFSQQLESAPTGALSAKQQAVTFFLADPELGVAGVYRANGKAVYFEARRAEDVVTGAPGALSLRFVDAEGRTLALGGEPLEKRWVPKSSQFTAADAGADAQLLSGLSRALQSASLHAALSAEKSALADLALQTAGTPAKSLPLRVAVNARKSAAADLGQVASFYEGAARGLQVKRDRSGVLAANLGNGIVLQATQQYVMEPDQNGRMGRIDAYSMVKSRDGNVLMAEFGGDNVPKEWTAALEKGMTRDHMAVASETGRAATALQALAYSGKVAKGVSLSYQSEQGAMQRMARSMVSNLLPQRAEEANATSAPGSSGFMTKATTYQTSIEVWRQPLWGIIAEHSGSRVNRYWISNGIRYFGSATHFCNHGECPYGNGMTRKCTYTGPYLSYVRQPTMNWGGGTCGTGYWAIGMKGHHNCHDDSATQVRAVRGLSYSPWGGRCDDWVGSIYAPWCDGN